MRSLPDARRWEWCAVIPGVCEDGFAGIQPREAVSPGYVPFIQGGKNTSQLKLTCGEAALISFLL